MPGCPKCSGTEIVKAGGLQAEKLWLLLYTLGLPMEVGRIMTKENNLMKHYWTEIGNTQDVNWHISHSNSQEHFEKSGLTSLEKIFPDLNVLPEHSRVLEIGCGKGRILRWLARKRPDLRIFGIDVAPSMITKAYQECDELKNITFLIGDGISLSLFPDDFFDYVFSFIVFQHLPRHIVQQYIVETSRILKVTGILKFQLQVRKEPQEVDPPWNDFRDIRFYTPRQAQALLGENFSPCGSPSLEADSMHDFFIEAKPNK